MPSIQLFLCIVAMSFPFEYGKKNVYFAVVVNFLFVCICYNNRNRLRKVSMFLFIFFLSSFRAPNCYYYCHHKSYLKVRSFKGQPILCIVCFFRIFFFSRMNWNFPLCKYTFVKNERKIRRRRRKMYYELKGDLFGRGKDSGRFSILNFK